MPSRVSTGLAIGAAAAAGVYVAVTLYTRYTRRQRVKALGGAVPWEEREGTVVKHGGRIELSPIEAFLATYAATLKGSYKLTVVLTVAGPVSQAAVTAAAHTLFARHPILRSKVVTAPAGPVTRTSALALEVDEELGVPVLFHEDTGSGSVGGAAEEVWRSFEKASGPPVCPPMPPPLFPHVPACAVCRRLFNLVSPCGVWTW